jgi:hypothetical protein
VVLKQPNERTWAARERARAAREVRGAKMARKAMEERP